jgi:hypothetical protein
VATLRCEIYEPPKKGMPFLAVGAIGTSLQFAYAAKTRKEAETLLAGEVKIIEQRAELHAMYGQHRDED